VCEDAGIPAIAVVTEVFENLARTAARARGFHDLRLHVLPHPMESRPEEAVRAIVRRRFAALVGALAGDA
jgi:hypothetical protein